MKHEHQTRWTVQLSEGQWRFCECGRTYMRKSWVLLDQAYISSVGTWTAWLRRFLKRHQAVIDRVPPELSAILIQWAVSTTVLNAADMADYPVWLDQYWSEIRNPFIGTVSIGGMSALMDDMPMAYANPSHKEQHVNFLIHTVRVQNGWIGQIIDGSLAGAILWESVPQEDQVNDDHEVVLTGQDLATRMASDKLTEVKKNLFA